MSTKISNNIVINVNDVVAKYCKENLELDNPEYYTKEKMGFYLGDTPKKINLYHSRFGKFILPFGCINDLWKMKCLSDVELDFADKDIYITGKLPLYDYQETAVNEMIKAKNGVLVSAAGSGKTQIGIELIKRIGKKTLWLTHTKDLLKQSKDRFETYLKADIGIITEGKADIKDVTFATVQTLEKMDLEKLKYEFSVVIVDECHRVAGSPSKLTMFYKVLDAFACRYKYGLTATAHRADGLIKSMYSIIGNVVHVVSVSATNKKTIKAKVKIINTNTNLNDLDDCKNDSGDIVFSKLISELCECKGRNRFIADEIVKSKNKSCIVLSDRLAQLRELRQLVGYGTMIDGKMTSKKGKEQREKAIRDMQEGKEKVLFASYNLAKEGLDITCLERLYMASPKKDYAVIVQSVGRIERMIEGKEQGEVYDFIDNIGICEAMCKSRIGHYVKNKNQFRRY